MNGHQLELHIPAPSADSVIKERARLAFAAYEQAVKDGDTELAEVAKKRFIDASAHLVPRRVTRRGEA